MTKFEVQSINKRRLEGWGDVLVEVHCTPAVLIGIGQDHQSGVLHICIPENLPIQFVRDYLARALQEVEIESVLPQHEVKV